MTELLLKFILDHIYSIVMSHWKRKNEREFLSECMRLKTKFGALFFKLKTLLFITRFRIFRSPFALSYIGSPFTICCNY